MSSKSSVEIRRTSSLLPGSNGFTIAQPAFIFLNAPSRTSSRSFALRFDASGPWQRKQRSDSSGRIWLVKSMRPPDAAVPVAPVGSHRQSRSHTRK